jgi:L-asparaginase
MNKMNGSSKDTNKILVIMTGGLITEKLINKEVVDFKPREILDLIDPEIDLDALELVEFSFIDSSGIDLEFLHNLAKFIQRKLNSQFVRGIVLLHGTDTIEITAYFLHRCIYAHGKPIVLTGYLNLHLTIDFWY